MSEENKNVEEEEYQSDDNSDEVAEAMHSAEEHAVREPDNFGGGRY